MVDSVDRHDPVSEDLDRSVRLFEQWMTASLEALGQDPIEVEDVMHTALLTANIRCITDRRAARLETWEAFVTAMQAGAALFEVVSRPPGETVECRIADEVRTLRTTGPNTKADAWLWLQAFWLAVICREQGRMTALSRVPLEVLRASGAVFDDYIYPWVQALQLYWREEPGMPEKLRDAFELTEPGRLRYSDAESMLYFLYPPLELFYCFVQEDHAGFNAALKQALESHRTYWTSQEDSRFRDLTATIALAPLAMACLAHDAGFPITVESDYLPAGLLDRGWLGEFAT